eukprot:scaffold35346_cov69-Phaeocystis_antarctica.AAC.3
MSPAVALFSCGSRFANQNHVYNTRGPRVEISILRNSHPRTYLSPDSGRSRSVADARAHLTVWALITVCADHGLLARADVNH